MKLTQEEAEKYRKEFIASVRAEILPTIAYDEITVGMLLEPGITRNMIGPMLKRKVDSGEMTCRYVIWQGRRHVAYRKA